jgi:histidine triad (HIT) family protein
MTTQGDHAHCTFCDLIRGAAEVSICHEDADAIAFMDIQPVNNGHVLVVPRAHYESLLDVPQEIGMHLFQVTMRLANAVRSVTGCNDLNIVVNSGAAAGQDEPHYHVHIIPRREGDGFDIPLPFNGSEMPDRTLLDAYAARIGSALSDPMKVGGSGSSSGGERSGANTARSSEGAKPEGAKAGSSKPAAKKADSRVSADMRAQPERVIGVPIFDELESESGSDDLTPNATQSGRLRVQEGAHGELTYEFIGDSHGVV